MVTLRWDPVDFGEGALVIDCGYGLHIGTANGVYTQEINAFGGIMYSVKLPPGTYYFAMTAHNKYGPSGYSEEISYTVPEPPPETPPPQPVIINIDSATVTIRSLNK